MCTSRNIQCMWQPLVYSLKGSVSFHYVLKAFWFILISYFSEDSVTKLKPLQWRSWSMLCIFCILNKASKIWLTLPEERSQHSVQPGFSGDSTANRKGSSSTRFALMPVSNNLSSFICKVETTRVYNGFVYMTLGNCLNRLTIVILG